MLSPEQNNYMIYIHVRNDNSSPFYIGKGKKYRPYNFNGRNKKWNDIYNECNKDIKVEILLNNLNENQALKYESIIEKQLINQGYILTNIAKTGLKGSTGHKKSEEWKRNYSKLMSNLNKNRKLTQSHKNNISKSQKNFGPRKWVSSLFLGKKQSKETCFKKSIKLKGRKQSQTEIQNRIISKYKPVIQLDFNNIVIKEHISQKHAELCFSNKNNGSISACCRKKQNSAFGYKWEYKK